jgi:hypothetical protein
MPGNPLEERFVRTWTGRRRASFEHTFLMALRNPGFKAIFRT